MSMSVLIKPVFNQDLTMISLISVGTATNFKENDERNSMTNERHGLKTK